MNLKGKNVFIAGLGLMGGAFAEAFRDLEPNCIYGYDTDPNIIEHTTNRGIIDEGFIEIHPHILSRCDLIMVCLYIDDAIAFICENMEYFKKGAIVTDIVGVKRKIISSVQKVLRSDIEYIPGHPMAGKERQGFGYADKSIFQGRNYILTITDLNEKGKVEFLEGLFRKIGFTNIVLTDPDTHDEKIAFTSQLCHVIASAMVDINHDERISNFEGGSFQDMTRIAMINSRMWSELFFANKDKLVGVLDEFQNSINTFKELIQREDPSLIAKLDRVKENRERLMK